MRPALGHDGGRRVLVAGSGVACAGFSLFALGTPATAMLIGAWLLVAGTNRALPALSGACAWAVAIIAEVALVVGSNSLVALVSPHPHAAVVSWASLVVPMAVGGGVWLWPARMRRSRRANTEPSGTNGLARSPHPFVAFAVVAVGVVAASIIRLSGSYHEVAWAMGGDARNHILLTRSVIGSGGLTLADLRKYPALINAVVGVLSSAGGRGRLLPGQLLLHDAQAVAATYILCFIGVSLCFAAAVMEVCFDGLSAHRRLPVGAVVTLLSCCALAASPLVLGTVLVGGFLSAYGTLMLCLAGLVVGLRLCRVRSNAGSVLLGGAMLLALCSWAYSSLILLVLNLYLLALRLPGFARRERSASRSRAGIANGILVAGCIGATMVALVSEHSQLISQLKQPGSIVTPVPQLLLILGIGVAVLLASSNESVTRRQFLGVLLVTLAGGAIIEWIISLSATGSSWGYYSIKTLWLFAGTVVWVTLVPVLRLTLAQSSTADRARRVAAGVTAAALCLLVIMLLRLTTPLLDPTVEAAKGWTGPSAQVVAATVQMSDSNRPFVFWSWSDPGNDRLGNFWAALTWDADAAGVDRTLPGTPWPNLEAWAYQEDGQTLTQMCGLIGQVPGLRVVTSDRRLGAQIAATCPAGDRSEVLRYRAPPT